MNNMRFITTLTLAIYLTGSAATGYCNFPGSEGDTPDSSSRQSETPPDMFFTYTYYAHPNSNYRGTPISRYLTSVLPDGSNLFDTTGQKGISPERIRVWGNMRFLTIYRNMKDYYADMLTREKSFAFSDYPIVNVGPGNNGSIPMLEMCMESAITPQIDFAVGYSYAHTFQSSLDNNNDKIASSRSDLRFGLKLKNPSYGVDIQSGHVVWTRVSRFTMGQPVYRDNYFDRMPWDWHRSSFDRFQEYYDYAGGNVGPEGFGRSPLYGTVAEVSLKKIKLNLKGVYGRTNRNTIQANSLTHFPSVTYAFRAQKGVLTKFFNGNIGVNYYLRDANTDRTSHIADDIQLTTIDFSFKGNGIVFGGEIGQGKITNPLSDGTTGIGTDLKVEVDESVIPVPFSLEYYNIDVNVVSLDGSIINSNHRVRDGGYANELIWDNMLFLNVAQEADLIANNRWGLILKSQKGVGKFKAELSYAMSQEKENLYDSIVFQHRANAFSRSRFRPWFQANGPYNRIKSAWFRTFETLTITDEANGISTDYKKGFNTAELLLKYNMTLFGKKFVLLNMNAYSSIQPKFSPLPYFNNDAFIRCFYTDITAALSLSGRVTVSGQLSFERAQGNNRVNVSPENGGTIDQYGHGAALGLDYDFAKTAGLHLVHRWIAHKDKNFVLDHFKGQETTVELKIFF